MRHEVPFLVAEEDRVAASIRVFFRKRANGRIVQFDIAAFYTLRDGRIATIHEIIDSFELVQQILETRHRRRADGQQIQNRMTPSGARAHARDRISQGNY